MQGILRSFLTIEIFYLFSRYVLNYVTSKHERCVIRIINSGIIGRRACRNRSSREDSAPQPPLMAFLRAMDRVLRWSRSCLICLRHRSRRTGQHGRYRRCSNVRRRHRRSLPRQSARKSASLKAELPSNGADVACGDSCIDS